MALNGDRLAIGMTEESVARSGHGGVVQVVWRH